MAQKEPAFDPYHKWLGIPKHLRPPTHYQLLGLAAGESDHEVIEEAAIRQTTHLRAYQVGVHAEACTRILNEVARARQVLLNPQKRKEYDRKLNEDAARQGPRPDQQVTARPPVPVTAPAAVPREDPFGALDSGQGVVKLANAKRSPADGMSNGLLLGVTALGLLLLASVSALAWFLFASGGDFPERKIVIHDEVKPLPEPPPVPEKIDPVPIEGPEKVVKPNPVPTAADVLGDWRSQSAVRKIDLSVREDRGQYRVDFVLHTAMKDYPGRGEQVTFEKGRLRFALIADQPLPASAPFEEVSLHPRNGSLVGMFRSKAGAFSQIVFQRAAGPVIAKVDPLVPPPVPVPKVEPKEMMKEPPAPKKADPPAEEKAREAGRKLREDFAKKYAAAKVKSADRAALAEEWLQVGEGTTDNVVNRYVLFTEARDLAVQAGKWSVAADAIDRLDRDFVIDVLAEREVALQVLLKGTLARETALEAAETALQSVGEAIAREQNARAAGFLGLASTAAGKAASASLLNQIKKHDAEMKTLTQEYEQVQTARATLKSTPDDPAANLAVGRYLTLRRGDWKLGLDHLARGGDDELALVARKELAKPGDAKSQQELGERWWALAEQEKASAWLRHAYLQRAGYWYQQAAPQLTGLAQTVANDRLRILEDTPSPLRSLGGDSLAEVRRFKGHFQAVTCLALGSDGKRLHSGGFDGTFRTWDVASTKQLGVSLKAGGPIHAFAISPSAKWIALNGKDTVLVLTSKGLPVTVTPRNEPAVPASFWSGADTLNTVGPSAHKAFDFVQGGSFSTKMQLVAPAIQPAGDHQGFLTLGLDVRYYRVLGLNGLTLRQSITVPEALCAAFGPDNGWAAIASTDHKIRLMSLGKNPPSSASLDSLTTATRALAVSPNGQRLLSGGDDKILHLWDTTTGKAVAHFPGHTGAIHSVLFTADGRYAFSGSADGTIRMWNLPRDRK